MTLGEYLRTEKITEAAFADRLGVKQPTINRYVRGERFPDRGMILRIEEVTEGRVALADWYAPQEAAE